jgi:molecular chaperone GrpE
MEEQNQEEMDEKKEFSVDSDFQQEEQQRVSLETKLQQSEKQIEELKDLLLRARADHENFRKRVARDHEEQTQLANATLLTELLPILDNFSLGLKAAEKSEDQSIVQGFRFIYDQLQQLLTTWNVATVGEVGKPFDATIADALATVASEDIPEGHVVKVVRYGYLLGKKLLRPAAVVVSQGPKSATP